MHLVWMEPSSKGTESLSKCLILQSMSCTTSLFSFSNFLVSEETDAITEEMIGAMVEETIEIMTVDAIEMTEEEEEEVEEDLGILSTFIFCPGGLID